MADLKSFAQPTNTTLYTDVVDTEKGFHGAHATMVHSGYASTPVGAINLDNPGGATRSFTQWNGTAYVGFTLGAVAFRSSLFDLNSTGAKITSNSTDTVFFGDSSGSYLQYVKAGGTWNFAIGGVVRSAIDGFANYTLNGTTRHIFNGTLQCEIKNTAAPTDQKNWKTITGPGFQQKFISNDADNAAKVYDEVTRVGNTITKRHLNQDGGRLLVGQGVTDDGVTALQTTSYSASNQPSLLGGVGPVIAAGAGLITMLSITSSTTKGGVTLVNSGTRITAPVGGVYMLSGQVSFSTTVPGFAYLRLEKNGAFLAFQGELRVTASGRWDLQVNLPTQLLANDYITISVEHYPNDTTTGASAKIANLSFTKLN